MTIRDAIGRHFNYPFDFQFVDVIEEIISRIDDKYDEDDIWSAIDDTLIYCSKEWIVAKFYNSSPKDIDWFQTITDLYNDVCDTLQLLK